LCLVTFRPSFLLSPFWSALPPPQVRSSDHETARRQLSRFFRDAPPPFVLSTRSSEISNWVTFSSLPSYALTLFLTVLTYVVQRSRTSWNALCSLIWQVPRNPLFYAPFCVKDPISPPPRQEPARCFCCFTQVGIPVAQF